MDESESLLLTLPEELLEHIISRNSYDGISQCRLVCKTFEKIAQRLLNQGFYKVDKLHSVIQKEVKAKLPRRESERRNHPLARHVDILAAIETRLSLLSMTFMKYIDMGLCCFIPGKVLDELFEVLKYVRKICNPPRAHELLQELRDISSMAMEHFDEHIVPILKTRMPPPIGLPMPKLSDSPLLEFEGCMTLPAPHSRAPGLRQDLLQLRHSQRTANTSLVAMRKELQEYKGKMSAQAKKLFEQEKQLTEQSCLITELQKKQTDQDEQVANLNRKITEYDQKFADIATRIDRICAVNSTDKMTSLSVEVHGTLSQGDLECGHLSYGKDVEKRSVKYTMRQRQKRHRQTDKGDTDNSGTPSDIRCASRKRTKISAT